MTEVDDNRLTVAMDALALMRYYEPLFPHDHVPFHAIAAAMAYAQDNGEFEAMASWREQIQERMTRLATIIELTGVTRGLLVAAERAIQCTMLAVSDDNQPDKAQTFVAAAREAGTGVGLPLL